MVISKHYIDSFKCGKKKSVGNYKWDNETCADLCSNFPRVNTKQIVAHIVTSFCDALLLICELICTQ